jgi:hypothetical protein
MNSNITTQFLTEHFKIFYKCSVWLPLVMRQTSRRYFTTLWRGKECKEIRLFSSRNLQGVVKITMIILDTYNPVHTFIKYLFKFHFNSILPSTPVLPKWSLPFSFCKKKSNEFLFFLCALHIPPIHLLGFHHPNHISWLVQTMKLLIMQQSPPPVTATLLGPNILITLPYYSHSER